jgi:hypothetical protein
VDLFGTNFFGGSMDRMVGLLMGVFLIAVVVADAQAASCVVDPQDRIGGLPIPPTLMPDGWKACIGVKDNIRISGTHRCDRQRAADLFGAMGDYDPLPSVILSERIERKPLFLVRKSKTGNTQCWLLVEMEEVPTPGQNWAPRRRPVGAYFCHIEAKPEVLRFDSCQY